MSSRPSLSRVTLLAMPDIGVCSPWLDPRRMDPGSVQGCLAVFPVSNVTVHKSVWRRSGPGWKATAAPGLAIVLPMSEKSQARLDLIAPAELDPDQRALYDAITGGPRASQAGTVPIADEAGRLLGPFAIMLLSPEVGNAMQQVGAKIRFGTALTGRERDLAILTVAGALNSEFERLAHVPAARGLGLTEPQIDATLAGRAEDDGLSADEAMVARLALAMTVDRTLSDEDYADGVLALGQERLAELTWLGGYYSAVALSLAVFRPVLPESFSAGH